MRNTRVITAVALTDTAVASALSDRESDMASTMVACDAAAESLGCDLPRYWSAPIIPLTYSEQMIARVLKLIEAVNPALVLAPSLQHAEADRSTLGLVAREAVRRASNGCRLAGYWLESRNGTPTSEKRLLADEEIAAKRAALAHFHADPLSHRHRQAPSALEVEHFEVQQTAAELIQPPKGIWKSPPIDLYLSGKQRPLVSVLIRTTGREELTTALDSIAAQTYPNLEVVLVDVLGGQSLELESSCSRIPLTLISKTKPLKRSRACNTALAAAKGTYISFLDDDDWLFPDHIERLVAAVEASTAAAAYSGVECRQDDGTGNWQLLSTYNHSPDLQRLIVDNYLPIHSVLFERRLVGQALQFDERFDLYEDWDFWLQLAALTPLEHVDRITAIYRIAATSGFGLQDGGAASRDAYKNVITKWHTHWNTEQLVALARGAAAHRASDPGGSFEAKQIALEARVATLEESVATLEESVVTLKQSVVTLETENQDLKRRLDQQKEELSQVKDILNGKGILNDKDLTGLEESLHSSRLKVAQLLNQPEPKRRCRPDSGQSLHQVGLTHQNLERGLQDLSTELDELLLARTERERATNELREEKAAALRRLDQIQTSTTWSVSAPLRALETRYPGLTRKLTGFPRVFWWAMSFRLRRHLRVRRVATRILASGMYDPAWYVAKNPDVVLSGQIPLVHWITTGWKEGRDPHPRFNTNRYLEEHPQVLALGINPLEHFLTQGAAQLSAPGATLAKLYRQSVSAATRSGTTAEYEADLEDSVDAEALAIRAIAFYLPQFHPIAENDAWWGEGFTEWMNVVRAVPQFDGHHQPRLPGALGFYDLRAAEVQHAQITLAKKYGIYGFCYHYYWFAGKRLLERPLQQVLDDPTLDLPFCVCWANENWTRRWDGEDKEVLIAQDHSPEDDLALFAQLASLFTDSRYITVGKRPLVLVYRPQDLPDPRATAERWREYAKSKDLPDPYLVNVHSFAQPVDPRSIGFDAAVEFPPHQFPRTDVSDQISLLNSEFSGHLLDYKACVTEAQRRSSARWPFELYPGVMAAWDNTARRLGDATVFVGATPDTYADWLRAASERARSFADPSKRMVFINAWNEWAEGTYLEPDRRLGYAYLRRTRKILEEVSGIAPNPQENLPSPPLRRGFPKEILLVGHDAHPHGAQLLLLNIASALSQQFGLNVVVWLLEGGDLAEAYARVAQVHIGAPSAVTRRWLQGLLQRGFTDAITNTVVTGVSLPQLKAAGFRVISLVHEMPQLIRERQLEASAQALADAAERIVFAAETVRDAFATVTHTTASKSLILPQGIYQDLNADSDARSSVERELDLPPDAILVMNAGYADRRKGFDWFLDCALDLVERDPRFHFLWVGNLAAEFQQRLKRERRSHRLLNRLHQRPFTKEIGRYLAAAQAFLLTSREDPFPSVVLEALASGLPVVAFEGSGGHCELLQEENLGALARPMGDIEALSTALRQVVEADEAQPERRNNRSRLARSRFDFRRYAWELLRLLYPDLLSVSVVVPNYNYAQHLEERLNSIFGQGYPVFEIILLDDASTDDSLLIAQRTAAKRQRQIRLIENRENSGSVFKQWAKGIHESEGQILWIAEADDVADAKFLEQLIARMKTVEDVRFAFSDSAQIDEHGRTLGASYADYCNEDSALDFSEDFELPSATFLTQGLAVKNSLLNVSAVLFVRHSLVQALDRVEDQLPQLRIAGDWRLYIELCCLGGSVHYVAQALNRHRRHANSVVGANNLQAHIKEIRHIHAIIPQSVELGSTACARQSAYLASLEKRVQSMSQR
ncbi:MAG: glycoside hydrolase family 99-like domain-containing protein [Chromatiaceae bacterium]|nr:glycoside hydrolase family 99-like domain-containing protein [Chromatiaceae bacterium]